MNPNRLARIVTFLALASATLTAQVDLQRKVDVPLKNWAAPLYWQPDRGGTQAAPRPTPQLKFSANQVSNGALVFVAITPCRLVDTRGASAGFNGVPPFSGPSVPSGGTLSIPVQSTSEASANTAPAPCGVIPSLAQAYSLNLTVVPQAGGAVDYISLWPTGGAQPFVATLNDPQGAVAYNAAIVPAGGPNGGIDVFNSGPSATDVIIDMNGYYTAPTDQDDSTATGESALSVNAGANNTADGYAALYANTAGANNTAIGTSAMQNNSGGNNNTAIGEEALFLNSTGANNTATGYGALSYNVSGAYNTANGASSLIANTASFNTATGGISLANNTTGIYNQADGYFALTNNTTGFQNSATGAGALKENTTGSNNVAVGFNAASGVAGGNSNNIHIGAVGFSGDNAVIRIGAEGTQTSTFIGGVYGVASSGGSEVFVNNIGQLGTSNSSRRFKEQITNMGDTSSNLFQLRPVNFFYKPEYDDGSHLLQYGLIAEEVAQVYPEMVTRDTDGQITTVRYQMLAPMLLNELQKQNAHVQTQDEELRQQAGQIRSLEDRLAALEAALSDAH